MLVTSEMDWTVRCFQYYERLWRGRAEEAKSPGHRAYGWKQSSTWARWAKTAQNTFRALKNV